jgi:hypothetical protein
VHRSAVSKVVKRGPREAPEVVKSSIKLPAQALLDQAMGTVPARDAISHFIEIARPENLRGGIR